MQRGCSENASSLHARTIKSRLGRGFNVHGLASLTSLLPGSVLEAILKAVLHLPEPPPPQDEAETDPN